MADLFGWVGKVLFVDLTAGTSSTMPTTSYVPKFIGGRALAAKLYWDTVPPGCAAFDPENRIIFASGPASGTLGAGARTAIASKSPELNPECYMYSVTGGHWSAQLKFAGFDAVVVSGKAPQPSYIWIHDGVVEIKSADRLWGMTTSQTDTEIRKLLGDKTRSMLIGPAGENLVRAAVVLTDGAHAAGIGGFGAVMGSKNLKAISVRGTGGVKVARPKQLMDYYDTHVKIGSQYGGPYVISGECYAVTHSTTATLKEIEDIDTYFNNVDSEWTKYWLGYKEAMAGTVKRKFAGCFACPACCELAYQPLDPTGKEAFPENLNSQMSIGNQCHEYQYQNLWEDAAFAGKLGGRPAIMDCANLTDLGLTVHALGSTHSWFNEAVTLKLLTKENTGLPVGGDAAAYNTPAMVGKDGYAYGITYRRNDFFKRVAEGPTRFLEGMAKESAAWKTMYEKYVSLPRYHGATGWSSGKKSAGNIIYDATQFRSHPNEASINGTGKTIAQLIPVAEIAAAQKALRTKYASLLGPKSLDLSGETATLEDKVKTAIFHQNMTMEMDSMPHCGWAGFPRFYSLLRPDHIGDPAVGAAVLAAVTGIDRTFEENVAAMEVPWTLERAIHVREGHRREHDVYTDPAFPTWTTRDAVSKAMDDYYAARGWDKATGIPTKTQLVKLGMTDVADDLEKKYGVKVPA